MSEVRNLHPDPRCLRRRETWKGVATANGEKWLYEKQPNYNSTLFAWWNAANNANMSGKVLYARITSDVHTVFDNLAVENATTIVRRDGWIAARVADDNTSNHTLPLQYGPLVLQEVGCYSPEDWEQLYALYQKGDITYPWVAGPRNATAAGEKGPWEL